MEAIELRHGNLVYGISDRVECICGITETTVKTRVGKIDKMFFSELKDIKPIPLTEDILLKAGFTFDGHIYEASNELREKSNKDIGVKYQAYFFNTRLNRWMDCQTRVCVDHLHQLQNIYFALTDDELTVNL